MTELAKIYDPQAVEKNLYQEWEKSGYFNPDVCIKKGVTEADAKPFSIVLPPPNVTGILHTGHAAMLAIQDVMVRYHRMRGDRTLWLPGTDHAAIATQSKVEKILKEETGQSRHDLGRELFLARVDRFAQDSHDTIVNQCRAMGASLDWSREAFTLDAPRHKSVVEAFRRMYKDGLIYRGDRIVNWDPKGQTTVSDDEVNHEDRSATLYTFRYSKDFPIPISTTRPETKVGDTAVAVHPDDDRYAQYVGQTFTVSNFCGAKLSIEVIADSAVEKDFGTGALGVTPAHSHADWDMSERHNLKRITVIGEDAQMLPAAGTKIAGQNVLQARESVVAWLRTKDIMESEEDVIQSISTAERTGGIIEPLPKEQWFIAVNKEFKRDGKMVTLKSLMLDAVRSGATDILPERFEKVYFHWIENLRDWCISRQIWYGHRIPVWYRDKEIVVSADAPNGDGWTQDPDTLDTWFSSGLWTFSTLGWPDLDAPDFKTYHPTMVLETGYDILFFWVARMILMSTYLVNTIPFKTVYLHGLVRDEEGRKMSKSLGNAINPLDVSAQYGTDAVRLSLLIGAAPGQDMRLGKEKIASYRNFTNKLWNIGRYVLMMSQMRQARPETQTDADYWIIGKLNRTIIEVDGHLEHYRFSQAGEVLRDFTWNDFADWYVEIHKIEKNDALLRHIFRQILALWHPFMPFVTEELFGHIRTEKDRDFLMVSQWPYVQGGMTLQPFETFKELIIRIRNIRAVYNLSPDQKPILACDKALFDTVKDAHHIITHLARISDITLHEGNAPSDSAIIATNAGVGYILLKSVIDITAEKIRLDAELAAAQKLVADKEARLGNESFTTRAPEAIVAKERELLVQAQSRADEIKNSLDSLS